MIVASAIKTPDGSVFVGKRHGDCYRNAKLIMKMPCPDERTFKAEQGFINDKLEFLDREAAYHEALRCGQCEEQGPWQNEIKGFSVEWKPFLSSEDLW